MKRTYFINNDSPAKFQADLNETLTSLREEGETLLDIKFSTSISVSDDNGSLEIYSAIIIYEDNK